MSENQVNSEVSPNGIINGFYDVVADDYNLSITINNNGESDYTYDQDASYND